MAEFILLGTIVTGVGVGVVAAKASVAWVVDRIPARSR